MTFNSTITNPTDINILRAFIWALAQLDESLSDDLQSQLNQISKELEINAEQAIEKLYQIAKSAPEIKDFYAEGSRKLRKEYAQQERSKVITLTVDPSDEETGETINVSLSTDALGSLEICRRILAKDSVETAQQVPQQLESDRRNIEWSEVLFM